MTYKVYSERVVKDDLGIEVTDEQSAQNIVNVLQAQNAGDIKYIFEEVVELVEETNENNETEPEQTETDNTNY